MTKMSRNKGQRGEREVCHILSAGLGFQITRELGAARSGGCDIKVTLSDITYMIEVKLHIKFSEQEIQKHWQQAIDQADEEKDKILNPVPLLIYRQNRWKKWQCRMPWRHMLWQLKSTKLARGGIDDVKDYVTMEMDKAMDIIDLNRTYNPSISKGTMDIYMEKS